MTKFLAIAASVAALTAGVTTANAETCMVKEQIPVPCQGNTRYAPGPIYGGPAYSAPLYGGPGYGDYYGEPAYSDYNGDYYGGYGGYDDYYGGPGGFYGPSISFGFGFGDGFHHGGHHFRHWRR